MSLYSRTVSAYAPLLDALGGGELRTVPISHDCRGGFLGAYGRRPERYLDPGARRAISALVTLDPAVRERGLGALESGEWLARHTDLANRLALDLGYRLVLARHN